MAGLLCVWLIVHFKPVLDSLRPGEAISAALLLTALTLLSFWTPATGPRYGRPISITPLLGLTGLLLLEPGFAVASLFLATALFYASEREPERRSTQIEQAVPILAAQLSTILLIWFGAHIGRWDTPLAAGPFARTAAHCLMTAALFGAVYLGGRLIVLARRSKSEHNRSGSSASAWTVPWINDVAIFGVGAPFALALSLLFTRAGMLIGTAAIIATTTGLLIVARLLVDGKMARRQLRALERLTQQAAIGKSPSTERFLIEFLEHCRRVILFDRATIWLYNEEELVLEKQLEYVSYGLTGHSIPYQPAVRRSGEDLVGRVMERHKAIMIADLRRDPRHRNYALPEAEKRAIGPVSQMLVPLLAAGDVVGVVEFDRREFDAYGRTERERVQSLASLVAMSLANNRLHHDVMQQAVTDGLTDLFNKRQILKCLQDEASRAQRYKHPLSVMMLDLDGFKKFNDTFGHMQGDLLLVSLAELIKQSIRTTDVAGRYGGEEFVIVMPETNREAAWVTAERIRARVEAEPFDATVNYEAAIGLQEPTADRQPRSVIVHKTISIGVATFPIDADDGADLLNRADEALYAAKNAGRNRVVLAGFPHEIQPRTMAEV